MWSSPEEPAALVASMASALTEAEAASTRNLLSAARWYMRAGGLAALWLLFAAPPRLRVVLSAVALAAGTGWVLS